jgi:hypothetical protein
VKRFSVIHSLSIAGLLVFCVQTATSADLIPNRALIDSAMKTTNTPVTTPVVSQGDIEKQLTILAEWDDYETFQAFLLWLPSRWNMYGQAQSKLDFFHINSPGTPNVADISLLPSLGEKGTIKAHLENNLAVPATALVTRSPADPKADDTQYNANFAIFFRVPCINVDVPEPVFETSVAAFLNGFVTRTILADFEDAMLVTNPGLQKIPDLPYPTPNFLPNPRSPFETPNPWAANLGFDAVVSRILTATPIQGDAMSCGWYAAQQLAHSEKRFRDAANSLLKMRLNTQQVGEIVGYTLNYLSGYLANQIQKKTAADPAGDQAILNHLATISIDSAAKVASTNPFPQLNNDLYAAIISAFTESASVPAGSSEAKFFGAFLLGFNQGTVRAADAVYADTFFLAYGLGYADGFRDGYSKGYAEGFRAGFGGGLAAAPSFFTGLGTFLGNVEKAGDDVLKVVGVIGAIFSL